jgi:hypothetical protein
MCIFPHLARSADRSICRACASHAREIAFKLGIKSLSNLFIFFSQGIISVCNDLERAIFLLRLRIINWAERDGKLVTRFSSDIEIIL